MKTLFSLSPQFVVHLFVLSVCSSRSVPHPSSMSWLAVFVSPVVASRANVPFRSVSPISSTDLTDSPQTYRSVARRKTDLMPTLPSPRDGIHFGSRSSLTSASHTPRSPGTCRKFLLYHQTSLSLSPSFSLCIRVSLSWSSCFAPLLDHSRC